MMSFLVALLALNAILHGAVIARFGMAGNRPPLFFGVIYAVLAVAAWVNVPFVVSATLIVALAGIIGLTMGFRRIAHEKTIERAIWALDAVVIVVTAVIIFTR